MYTAGQVPLGWIGKVAFAFGYVDGQGHEAVLLGQKGPIFLSRDAVRLVKNGWRARDGWQWPL